MPLIWGVLWWWCGLWLATMIGGSWIWWSGMAGVVIMTGRRFASWWPHGAGWIIGGCVACLLGGSRMAFAQTRISESPLIAYHHDTEVVTVIGTVVEEPAVRDQRLDLTVAVEAVALPGQPAVPTEGLVLVSARRYPSISYGAQLQLQGHLTVPTHSPQFDYRDYLARQGIHSVMRYPEMEVLSENHGWYPTRLLLQVKHHAHRIVEHLFPAPESGLLAGILLGIDHQMPEDLETAFRVTGITHIVVISGSNVALLSAVFLTAMTPLLGRRRAAWAAMGGIALYAVLVGADPAVVRAAIMGGTYVMSHRLLGRRTDVLSRLFLAGGFMTIFAPFALWDVGFQLSFIATLSLILYADPLTKWSRQRLELALSPRLVKHLMGILSEAVLMTIAAQILTLPLLVATFGELSLISFVANAFIIPAQAGIMVWGGLTVLLGAIFLPVAQIPAAVVFLLLRYTIRMADLWAQVPYAQVAVELPFGWLMVLYGGIGAVTWYAHQEVERRIDIRHQLLAYVPQRLTLGALLVGLILCWHWVQTRPDGNLHVSFFDVGQGDATLIQTPTGRQILVDGGYYPTIIKREVGEALPFWDRTIDAIVVTHADADHVNGLPPLFDRYHVDELWVASAEPDGGGYAATLEAAAEGGTTIRPLTAGTVIQISDGVTLTVVHPGQKHHDDRNNNSLSVRVAYGDFSLLLTGDAEYTAEQEMLAAGRLEPAVVFKAGHHGAANATTMPLLQTVRPTIVVVSAGKDNLFGHPAPEVLERAAAVGAAVLRTDELGTIHVVTDGEHMWWRGQP